MALPAYPSGIAYKARVDSWSMPKMYLDPLQTDMDGGNKRLRTRPGDDVQEIKFDVVMSKADFATFQTFVLTTLNRGTSRFTMDVWMGNATVNKTVQFASPPQPTTNEPVVIVSFDLWVYP